MTAIEFAQSDYFQGLAKRLTCAKHGQRSEIVKEAASFLGRSADWVYAQLKIVGWSSGRKSRTDRGNGKLTVSELTTLSSMMRQSKRDTGKQLLCVEDAVNIAKANNMISVGDVSTSTVLRGMKLHGIHPTQVNKATSHTTLRSLHPNHVWQFDVSICVLYYLKDKAGLQVMPKDEFYKNGSSEKSVG